MNNNIEKQAQLEMVKLPEIVFFQEGPGVRNNQYKDSGVKLINVANLKDGEVYLDNTTRYISEEEAYGRYNHFLVDEGDLIIASSGIKVEYFDKKMGFVKKEQLPLCMNTSTIRFKSLDENKLDVKYFSYFLKTIYFKKQIARLITGSAQLNFGPSHLKQINVILAPINIQNKIVKVLDRSQELINKRKEQIEALDELVKSKFIEMFGKCDSEIVMFKNIADVSGGLTKNSKRKDMTCKRPMLRVANVYFNKLKLDEIVDIGLNEREILKTELKFGDLLFVEGNGSIEQVGRVALWNNEIEGCVHQNHLIKARFTKKINNIYVLYYFMSKEGREQIMKKANSTSGLQTLSISKIESLNIKIPPIELQNQFADFVKQVDKLKFEMENSLKELENNFNSLIQKAFKGELFN